MYQYFAVIIHLPFLAAALFGINCLSQTSNILAQPISASQSARMVARSRYKCDIAESDFSMAKVWEPKIFAEAASMPNEDVSSSKSHVVSSYSVRAVPASTKPVWGPNTSGPFFTGTAEVEPMGSWYVEPFMFDYRKHGSDSNTFTQKMAIGMGHRLEFDVLVPLIHNSAEPPATPNNTKVSEFGPGDTHLGFKYGLTTDTNTLKFLARPAIALTADFFLPSGNAANLSARRYGVDQFGNGTYQEGLSLLVHKRARPFAFYGQLGDLVEDPTNVSKGYGFNDGIDEVSSGTNVRMLDGNLLYYSGALEYVLNTKHGIGFVTEATGQSQSSRNLFFGKATAPSYSYLWLDPAVEFTWPAQKRFAITWGGGVALSVARKNYPRVLTPMLTATFYFNGPKGGRSAE